MTRNDAQVKLRLPRDLKQKIEEQATAHRRTMNAELVFRIKQSFDFPGPLKRDEFTAIIADAMEETVRKLRQETDAPDDRSKGATPG